MATGWYEINKSTSGQFHFVLKAANAETILVSELYTTHDSAMNGIASVQKNSPNDSSYDRLISKGNHAYFNLKAANNQVIGTSQMYASAANRDIGIESVKVNGPTTTIKDSSRN